MRRWLSGLLAVWMALVLLCGSGAAAQQGDSPSVMLLPYDTEATGTITDQAIFDHWLIDAAAGDVMQITLTGTDGLAPFVGVLNSMRSLQASSTEGSPNGVVSLRFDVPENGQYIVVATRAGSEVGTTTGGYHLIIQNLNPVPTATPLGFERLLFNFDCNGVTAAPILSIEFSRDNFDAVAYSIRAYGFDGFQPAVRVQSGGVDTCTTTPADALGDQIAFPGESAVTLTTADLAATTQQVITEENIEPLDIRVVFANLSPVREGRFAAVIGGFRVEPLTNIDHYTLQLAPGQIAVQRSALFYTIGINNRLDPTVQWAAGRCDDAGRRGCEDIPAITRAGVTLNNGVAIIGDRFDAGMRLTTPEAQDVQVLSFGGTTNGEYALVVYSS